MKILRRLPLFIMLFVVARCASAQGPEPLSFRNLSASTPQATSPTNRVRELKLKWPDAAATTAGAAATKPGATPQMLVVGDESITGSIRRERAPQLSEDQLVIVQRASDGRAIDWVAVPDPRVVRAEIPGADGKLTGRVIYRTDVELLVTLPRLATAVSLSVYQPRWNGTEYLLNIVGEVQLPRTR